MYSLIIWGVLAILGVLLVDQVVMPWFTGQFKDVVQVQDFTGMSSEEAKELGKRHSLVVRIDTTAEYSMEIPAGHILKQRPFHGTTVKQGRQIWVTISKGRREVDVPKVLGLSIRQAEIVFQKSGLKLGGVVRKTQPSVPKGVVFKTNPPMSTPVKTGSQIQIYVSKGGKDLVLGLVGLSLAQAESKINESGYTLGTVQYISEPDVLPNTVLYQEPKNPIFGKPINLTVSK
jgi:serine/threonine-protein kinase